MKLELKYGCNPNQKNSYIEGNEMPLKVLNGKPSFINIMDALNSYQLVKELKMTTGLCAAASFKHVSPAGSAVAIPLSDIERKMYFIREDKKLTDLATAYIRARGADRMASFGDFIALSEVCDKCTASIILKEVSDGIIAPGYDKEALEILKKKKKGSYLILEIDSNYKANEREERTIYGLKLVQDHNSYLVDENTFKDIRSKNKELSESAKLDLTVAMMTLKYTQSNSVCYAKNGQVIAVGSGQQSRLACTRLSGSKADLWHLRMHEKVLGLPFKENLTRNDKDNVIEQYLASDREIDVINNWQDYFTQPVSPISNDEKKEYLSKIKGVSLASDGFFPFRDNIDRAARSCVSYICEPGGSKRDESIIEACNDYNMVLIFTGVRLFHH